MGITVLTAAGFYLRYLLDALAGLGVDVSAELPALGVDQAALANPSCRVSVDVVDQILNKAAQADAARLADGAAQALSGLGPGLPLGLRLGAAVTPVALDVLAYASMSSGTLGDAIALLCQFEPYRLGFAQCGLKQEGGEGGVAVVELQLSGAWASLPLQVETAFAGWVEFGRWITGNVSHPVCIEFAHQARAPVAVYEAFFHCPVFFERPRHAVHVHAALLSRPLAASNPHVSHLMREELQRRVDRYAKGEQFMVRLVQAIEACLADGTPSLDQVAQAMSLAPRQLRAQAAEAGTTLVNEVDAVRQRLARQYLMASMPLAEISQRLGYSEQSAFSRACVRWFGVSPGKWRPDQAASTITFCPADTAPPSRHRT